jgi:hypothetical protein
MELISQEQVAKMIGVKVSALQKWRVLGRGPDFIKVGGLVRYEVDALKAWLKSRTRSAQSSNGKR